MFAGLTAPLRGSRSPGRGTGPALLWLERCWSLTACSGTAGLVVGGGTGMTRGTRVSLSCSPSWWKLLNTQLRNGPFNSNCLVYFQNNSCCFVWGEVKKAVLIQAREIPKSFC